MTTKNSVPQLLQALGLSSREVAKRTRVTRNSADFWRLGRFQPEPPQRAALVKFVRAHAAQLMKLADAIEREGTTRTSGRR